MTVGRDNTLSRKQIVDLLCELGVDLVEDGVHGQLLVQEMFPDPDAEDAKS